MYIITGVSRGIGKAIAEYYLNQGEQVLGIGRSHSINHEHFSFLTCDLSDLSQVKSLELPAFGSPVTLINNAGVIGRIQRLSDQEELDIDKVLTVNVSAVAVLTHKVYVSIEDKNTFSLVNISSGAANRAIPSWAAYCTSKAALNMLSEAFFAEEREKGFHPRVLAVAPGVVDTDMQGEIRAVDDKDFSSIERFKSLKTENQLFSPEEVARRLAILLETEPTDQVFRDLRDIS